MIRVFWILIVIVLLGGVAAQMAGASHGTHYWWEKIPGFWGLLGFGGGTLLVLVSVALRRIGIKRKDDAYGMD